MVLSEYLSGEEDLARDLPCDFLVFRDRGFDPSRVLVPTAGGPDSDLSASVAHVLHRQYDSEITLLHVAGDESKGETLLSEWAEEHDLEDVTLRVEIGDVEQAIGHAAEDATLVIVGATERGLLSRLVRGSLHLTVVEEIDCSVLLAGRKRERSLRERLFG